MYDLHEYETGCTNRANAGHSLYWAELDVEPEDPSSLGYLTALAVRDCLIDLGAVLIVDPPTWIDAWLPRMTAMAERAGFRCIDLGVGDDGVREVLLASGPVPPSAGPAPVEVNRGWMEKAAAMRGIGHTSRAHALLVELNIIR